MFGWYLWSGKYALGRIHTVGHGEEAGRTTDGVIRSGDARPTKRKTTKNKIWRGGERAGCRDAGGN